MKARGSTLFRQLTFIGIIIAMIFSPIPGSAQEACEQETYKFERLWPTLHQPWYFGDAEGIAVDSKGYVYVPDIYTHSVRKFTSDGHLVTRWGTYGDEKGQFKGPSQVAIDHKNGWLYVVEKYGNRVQKFTLNGEHTNIIWGSLGHKKGEFNSPRRIAVDKEGFVYVSDSRNYRIQKFTSAGEWMPASWGIKGEGDGEFLSPRGIAFDSQGFVYVTDSVRNCVQKFTREGKFLSKWGDDEDGEGGLLNAPNGLAIDKDDFIYVVNEGGDSVQKFDLKGDTPRFVSPKWGGESGTNRVKQRIDELIDEYLEAIQTYRMNFQALKNLIQYLPNGIGNGEFKTPKDIAIDHQGFVYIADTGNQRIQKFSSEGNFLSKWASVNKTRGTFQSPLGVAVYGEFIYVADSGNNRIQQFRRNNGEFIREWGGEGNAEGQFRFPADVAVDSDGNVYVADTLNARIQKFSPDGDHLNTWGEHAIIDGKLETGPDRFLLPVGITVRNGFVYVADLGQNQIRNFKTDGTYVKQWNAQSPVRVAVDQAKNVYSVNQDCNCVQKFTPGGTRVEDWQIKLSGESEITGTSIEYTGLTIANDPENGKEFLYVSTGENNYRIWKFRLDTGKAEFCTQIGEPGHEIGQMVFPCGIDVDEDGRIYVADTGNHRIQVFRKGLSDENVMKAIIVAGTKAGDDEIENQTRTTANRAYRTFLYQGFTRDNIRYLSFDRNFDLDGNGKADDILKGTNNNLHAAIEWAEDVHDVTLYLIDHGGTKLFRMNGRETLDADVLDNWLDKLQESIPGTLTVIYDACYSGSFIDSLAAPGRIVITSTSPEEEAVFFSQGAVSFSSYFLEQIFNGASVKEAFDIARLATGYNAEKQIPLLEDDGKVCPNPHELCPEDEDEDGDLARITYIGNNTRNPEIGPELDRDGASPDQAISGTNSATLFAKLVTDEAGTDNETKVWAVIRPPGYVLSGEPVDDLPQIDLKYNSENARYEGTYDEFNIEGEPYQIAFYAMDSLGNMSCPILTSVTVEGLSERKAVIFLGGSDTDEIWPAEKELGKLVYEALSSQGYSDNDIYLKSPISIANVKNPDAFSLPWDELKDTISSWMGENTQDLVLYMVGSSNDGSFQLNSDETLSSDDLGEWLDELQTDRIPGKITVIYDSCHSQSFLQALVPPAGKERIRIASTGEHQKVHFLARGNLSFSKYFWSSIKNGRPVYDAFTYANTTLTGTLDSEQIPQYIGDTASKYFIGRGILTADDNPAIGEVSAEPRNLMDETSADIWAKWVTTTDEIDGIWAMIIPPGGVEGSDVCCITDQAKKMDKQPDDSYKLTHDDFTKYGTYTVLIYAKDTKGNISETKSISICHGYVEGEGECWESETPDLDNDGVPDEDDTFPENPDEQYDSDADGIGDNEDQDDDDDGIIDMLEEYYDTNP
ncbi:MAG: hypothetical protein DRI57_08945, partial [Deltaproteobacteria bacterium]